MDAIRLLMLTGCFLSAMLGGLYATGGRGAAQTPVAVAPLANELSELADVQVEMPMVRSLPVGLDVPLELLAEDEAEVMVDSATGVRMGPLTLRVAAHEPVSPQRPSRATGRTLADRAPALAVQPRPAPRRASHPAEMPRLDADPGRHVILTARGMMARGETVRGSCYAYMSEVFDRAGHEGWRTRQVIHQAGAHGPYANLDQIQPGDWLYIVTSPDSTPIGTHSVLFLGWEDRANGYARTISHPGWAAGASAGREGSHDVNRTYRIIRPRMAQ